MPWRRPRRPLRTHSTTPGLPRGPWPVAGRARASARDGHRAHLPPGSPGSVQVTWALAQCRAGHRAEGLTPSPGPAWAQAAQRSVAITEASGPAVAWLWSPATPGCSPPPPGARPRSPGSAGLQCPSSFCWPRAEPAVGSAAGASGLSVTSSNGAAASPSAPGPTVGRLVLCP